MAGRGARWRIGARKWLATRLVRWSDRLDPPVREEATDWRLRLVDAAAGADTRVAGLDAVHGILRERDAQTVYGMCMLLAVDVGRMAHARAWADDQRLLRIVSDLDPADRQEFMRLLVQFDDQS